MGHEEYKERRELEALGLLEEAERRALRVHLTTCDECRADLFELRDAVAALVYLSSPAAPSPGLRERILEDAASRVQKARAEKTRESGHEEIGGGISEIK